jgi:tetratricopeptide (TPR) repeat protein
MRFRLSGFAVLGLCVAAAAQELPKPSLVPAEKAAEQVSPLPPPATRSGLRGRWFEFLSALNDDDLVSAKVAIEDLLKTADRVGISRLSDFSRAALMQARLARQIGKTARAELALDSAIRLDPELIDPRWRRVEFLIEVRRWTDAAAAVGSAVRALLGAHESRREFLSNGVLLVGMSLGLSWAALVLALLVRHIRKLAHDQREISSAALGSGGFTVLLIGILGLPLLFSFGPVWIFLYWSVLVSFYAERPERILLWSLLLILGLVGPAFSKVADQNLIARSPLVSAAIDLVEHKEEGGSVDLLRRASEIFPEDPDVWYLLGRFAQRRDDYEEAASDYARALKADPGNFRTMIAIGNIHFWQGDLTEAVADYRNAITVHPTSALAHYNLSLAQGDSYLFDQQRESLANARRLSQREVDHWIESPTLGRVLSLDYSVDEAETRSRRWGREPKSQVLPGIGHEPAAAELFGSAAALGPWCAALAGLLVALLAHYRGWGASECARCGRAYCARCRLRGGSSQFCPDCARLSMLKDGADIALHAAHAEETRRQQRLRQRERRWFSLVLPGARRIADGQPARGFLTLLIFFFILALAAAAGRLFPIRSLPAGEDFPIRAVVCYSLAFLLWLSCGIRVMRN